MKEDIINSFNKIAELEDRWDHNRFYEKLIMKQVKKADAAGLDIGCGTGEFTQRLAGKITSVCGIDFAPKMIIEAEKRHRGKNIKYIIQDINELTDDIQYDYIVSIATFHHLDLETVLPKIKALLKENGKLIVLDLYKRSGLIDFLLDCIAVPVNLVLQLIKSGRIGDEEKTLWKQHSILDEYMTYKHIKKVFEKHLDKGISIKRLLLWRYIMVYINNH